MDNSTFIWFDQISRQELLQSGCEKLANYNTNNNFYNKKRMVHYSQLDHILVNHEHKVLYCYVPKVACTNWKRVLWALDGHNITQDLTSISASLVHANGTLLRVSDLDEKTARRALGTYTAFLMVRHPFERLLSAFRNKLEDDKQSAKYFQARVGKHIIKKYRPNPRAEDVERGDNVSFFEFVLYLINEGLVHDETTNEHWKPVYKLCHPCTLNYTFIGHYEKFDEDARALLKMIRAPSHINFPQTKSSQTSDKIKRYFQQLSLRHIEQLYRFYEMDFKLFGYNLENILGFDIG